MGLSVIGHDLANGIVIVIKNRFSGISHLRRRDDLLPAQGWYIIPQ